MDHIIFHTLSAQELQYFNHLENQKCLEILTTYPSVSYQKLRELLGKPFLDSKWMQWLLKEGLVVKQKNQYYLGIDCIDPQNVQEISQKVQQFLHKHLIYDSNNQYTDLQLLQLLATIQDHYKAPKWAIFQEASDFICAQIFYYDQIIAPATVFYSYQCLPSLVNYYRFREGYRYLYNPLYDQIYALLGDVDATFFLEQISRQVLAKYYQNARSLKQVNIFKQSGILLGIFEDHIITEYRLTEDMQNDIDLTYQIERLFQIYCADEWTGSLEPSSYWLHWRIFLHYYYQSIRIDKSMHQWVEIKE